MSIPVHSDSGSGDVRVPVRPGPKSGQNVINLDKEADEIIAKHDREREVDNLYQQLPVQKMVESNINFLGSSYSGSDIKVVVHLYDSDEGKGEEARLARLTAQRDTAQAILDGCTSLLGGGLDGLNQQQTEGNPLFFQDYSAKRELFVAATGLSNIDPSNQNAINVLTGNIFKNGNFTFLGTSQMKRRTEQLKHASKLDVDSFQAQIVHLETIDKESSSTVVLGTLQTLSVQSFREKNAVRALGHAQAKGYTRGARTIGGSMIFTIFNEHALSQLISQMGNSNNYGERDKDLSTILPDQLPPVDITIVFANEYGAMSDFRLYGVEWVTDGSVFSVEDLLSEGTMNFVCRDADVMTARGKIRISRLQRGMFDGKDDKDLTGSDLLFNNDDYDKFLDKLNVRRRLTNR